MMIQLTTQHAGIRRAIGADRFRTGAPAVS